MKMTLRIVARRQPHAFEVLPRRWVVERTFAWISKHRRTVRDYETLPASHEAMILWAMTALMARRLAQPAHLSNAHLDVSRRAASTQEAGRPELMRLGWSARHSARPGIPVAGPGAENGGRPGGRPAPCASSAAPSGAGIPSEPKVAGNPPRHRQLRLPGQRPGARTGPDSRAWMPAVTVSGGWSASTATRIPRSV